MWLLWDYDRLWGIFDFGYTKGVFLVDPGVNLSLSDVEDGQELPFTWRGAQKANPNTIYCNETFTKGKIRINPWEHRLEGFFEFMMGDGRAGTEFKGQKCGFHAKPHFGPRIVPYTLQDTVKQWNDYFAFPGLEEKVGQLLPPAELAADLRRRDGIGETVADGEEEDDDYDEDDDDDLTIDYQESSYINGMLTEVFDNYGRYIKVRFGVDKDGNVDGEGRFDGDFKIYFEAKKPWKSLATRVGRH